MIDIKSLSRTPETKLYQDNSGRKKNHRLATQHTKCRKDKRIVSTRKIFTPKRAVAPANVLPS